MSEFAQRATQLGALRSILASYPYSVGLFREILQNADDAQATKQVCDGNISRIDSILIGCRSLFWTVEHTQQHLYCTATFLRPKVRRYWLTMMQSSLKKTGVRCKR